MTSAFRRSRWPSRPVPRPRPDKSTTWRSSERLTTQIADWLERAPKGSFLEAEHTCISLRGVQKLGVMTVTSALRGQIHNDARTRQEFLALTKRSHSGPGSPCPGAGRCHSGGAGPSELR